MVNKSEVVNYVAANNGLSKKSTEQIVDDVFSFIGESIADGNEVSIKGFGKFIPKTRAARLGRNPKSGADVQIAEKNSVSFKPASALKNTLN